MKSKILKILLSVVFGLLVTIIITTSAVAAFAAEATTPSSSEEATVIYSGACGTSLTWKIDDTGTLTIDGTGAMETYSYGSAPWYAYSTQITKIVVNDGITGITKGAFYGCSSLKEMTLPFVGDSRYYSSSYGYESLFGYIFGEASYTGATSTQQYYLNYSGEMTGEYYYIPTSLTKVTITDASTIYYGAFFNCSYLKELNLNDEIKTIEDYAFYGCSKIDTFKLPSALTSLGANAMNKCDALTDIEIPVGVKVINNYTFYDCGKLSTVKFHSEITSIGSYSFSGCSTLKNVDLPEQLTSIGSYAFADCASFTAIVIPDKVKTIDSYAFAGCSKVENVTVGKSVKTIGNNAFQNLSKITEIVFPNSVTSIGSATLKGCSSLKELSVPFVGGRATTTVEYGSSTYDGFSDRTYVLGYIFGWYESSASSSVSGTVYQGYGDKGSYYYTNGTSGYNSYCKFSEPYYADYFYIPSSLTKVTITGSSAIAYGAFHNCTSIKEIAFADSITQIGDYAFKNLGLINSSKDNMVISNHILLAYKGTDSNVTIPDGIKVIAPRAFYENKNVGIVTLDDATNYIGAYAFYNCTSTLVNVPRISGTLTIAEGAFTNTASVKYLDKSSYTNGNDTYYYTIDGEGNAVIVGCSTTSTNITLPNTLGGYTVTTVGYKGMANCTTLKGVTIPNNIIKLDLYAFAGCTKLDTATIPATCVYVGQYAFSGCTSLTTVVIAEGVTYLGDYCFEKCTSLTEIVVPDSCTYLGDYAFYNCRSMESATIGITVPAIGKYAFYNCQKLATVVIGIEVESIGEYAFYNTALTRLTTPTSLKHIGDYAFASCDKLERVALKTGLLTIGDGAFMGDVALTTINWTSNINSIGAYAFHGCSSLASATIPAGVTEIKDYTFAYCTSLASVTVKGTLTSIGEKAFYRDALTAFTFTDGLTTIGADAFAFNALEAITLPNSLVYIGEQAFNECSSLATVSMPDSVAYVGAYAFSADADNLTVTIRYNSGKIADYMLYNMDVYKVIMEEGISEIGSYVFALCHELAEIEFPSTLKKIGNYAFYDNRMYDELTLPNAVETIGSYAFARGYQLVKISIPDSVKSIGTHAFMRGEAKDHIDPEITIHIYYNKGVICDNLLDGQDMHHIIVADHIHTVGNNAFSNATNLMDISLPDTIASFGNYCFQNDTNIVMTVRTVDGLIDDNVYNAKLDRVVTVILDDSNIGDYAFAANPGLLKLTINATSESFDMTSIGSHGFDSCKSMGAVILPTTVNYIGSYAFYDCNSMSSINIPDGIEKILSHTFYGCASLVGINVPNSVIAIEDYAFYGCVVAKNITLSNQCKAIGDYAFYNCKALTELDIPDSVTSIGAYAFRSCGGITELVFSDNVDKIGACAFYDCNGLKTVKLGKKIIELGDRMFYGCVNLDSLYVYAPLSYIDELAFYGAEDVTVYCGLDDYMIEFFDENGIFYEILDDLVYQYKITFVTDNGEIISSGTYDSGSTITAPTNPTKTADKTYTYVFAGWDQEVTVVGGNKTYTASFTPVYIEYTVEFKDQNGNTLSTKTYHYGDEVTAPSNPTKAADNTYTYAFAGWNKEVVACEGDATYTATFTPTYIEYTVEFKDFGGETISSNTYHYGDAIVVPANPTRAADLLGTYSFKGWDKAIVACAGNATYTATYDITYIDYTVTFKNYDGSTISTKTYHYGDTVTVPTTPIKAADETYTYVFAGWNNTVTVCEGNAEYVATFTPKYIEYTVVFKNYDDTVISTKTYHYGQSVTAPTNPTKPSDVRYSYTFAGWDTPVTACAGDATYKATYSSEYIDYTITFVDYNGTVLGTKTYHYGETIEAIADPTKAADNTYTYAFAGWDKALGTCEGNETFTATYTPTYIEYKVVFKNHDGTTITEANYHYGATVVEPSTIPTKLSDNTYTYTFNGWDKSITTCKGDAVYTATFTPVYINYTITFKNDNGSILSTQTYHYGETITQPTTPTKASDKVYSYSFKAWDKAVIKCEGDATYTATYTPTYIEYTVKFVDEDNTPISTRTYHYGDTIVAPTTPTKASDNTYNYTFAGWDKAVTNCDGDATYKATYTSAYINYTVVFKNYNDDVISSKTYHYGDAVVVPGTPKKPSDANYCYVFVGWDKSVTNCYGDAVYTAKFTASDLPIVAVDSYTARAGEIVTLNVVLSNAPALESLSISEITYNTSALELISVEWKVTNAFLLNWDDETGMGAVMYSSPTDLNGTILAFSFKVKGGAADGNYSISCKVASLECNFKNVSGEITVCTVIPGDVDGNELVDKNDAIRLMMHIMFPSTYPLNQNADFTGDSVVDKADAIYLMMHIMFPSAYPIK